MLKPFLLSPKSLWSYNPIPRGCVLYLPLWHPNLSGLVFKSIDSFRHTCTVVGATHASDGRDFDGADDKITVTAHAGIANVFDGGGTYICWMNPDSDGEGDAGRLYEKGGAICYVAGQANGTCQLWWYYVFSGDDYKEATLATVITIGSWQMVTITYNCDAAANRALVYINGAAGAWETTVAPTGARADDSAVDMVIGNAAGQGSTFDGKKGEEWLYNRILSATEIAHVYNVTKGRY